MPEAVSTIDSSLERQLSERHFSRYEQILFSPCYEHCPRRRRFDERAGKNPGERRKQSRFQKDVLDYVERRKSGGATAHVKPSSAGTPSGSVEVIKMDTMRKAIAEHMVRSISHFGHVGSVTEADVTKLVALGKSTKEI